MVCRSQREREREKKKKKKWVGGRDGGPRCVKAIFLPLTPTTRNLTWLEVARGDPRGRLPHKHLHTQQLARTCTQHSTQPTRCTVSGLLNRDIIATGNVSTFPSPSQQVSIPRRNLGLTARLTTRPNVPGEREREREREAARLPVVRRKQPNGGIQREHGNPICREGGVRSSRTSFDALAPTASNSSTYTVATPSSDPMGSWLT